MYSDFGDGWVRLKSNGCRDTKLCRVKAWLDYRRWNWENGNGKEKEETGMLLPEIGGVR